MKEAVRGKSTDGIVSRSINRKVSSRITKFIVEKGIPVTPNQVSATSFLIALAASILYMLGLDPLAGVLVQLASIVDGVDGELARARGVASPLGAFLDSVLDRIADAAIVLGLAASAYKHWGPLAAIPGAAALLGCLMVSYLHSQGRAALGVHISTIGKVPMYASRDVRLFVVFVGSVLSAPFETLVAIAALSLSYVVAKTVDVYLHFNRLPARSSQ